jgi:hypothetical protein
MPYHELNEQELDFLLQFKHVFVNVQGLTKVPWQALAGIWYRESFSVAPPKTVGGPMQFDPPLEQTHIMALLLKYTPLDGQQIKQFVLKGINDFPTAVLCAACFLKMKMNEEDLTSDNQVKEAMWAYNGRIGYQPEDSSYVYNGFDKAHYPMKFWGTESKNGKRVDVEIIDKRPGAYVVYTQLVKLS